MQKPIWYKLDGIRPVPDETRGIWMINNPEARKVALTQINEKVKVSTVFLCLDHNFSNTGKPILFETLVFDGYMDGEIRRYTNWIEAEQGHQEIVDQVKKKMNIL